MRTDDLIALLATRIEAVDSKRLRRRHGLILAGGCLASLAICATALKINPGLSHFVLDPMFWVREAFCVTLAVTGILAVFRMGRPGRKIGFLSLGACLPLIVLWILATITLISAPPNQRLTLILGHTARACPFLIALLATPIFIVILGILRTLAPTYLRGAGAAAGFASGSLGAMAYTLHCPELEAAFISTWYVAGILLSAAMGALIGPRLLRW